MFFSTSCRIISIFPPSLLLISDSRDVSASTPIRHPSRALLKTHRPHNLISPNKLPVPSIVPPILEQSRWRPQLWIMRMPMATDSMVSISLHSDTKKKIRHPVFSAASLVTSSSKQSSLTYEIEEAPRYERDNRSASPRGDNGHDSTRRRSASPAGNGDRYVSHCLTFTSPP